MDRVFLDANILFSVAFVPDSRLRELWSLREVELLTSEFALDEAQRNLLAYAPQAVAVLDELTRGLTIVSEAPSLLLPTAIDLPDKDRPILVAAIAAGCTHLLTGDTRHFGPLYGRTIQGVVVLTPAQYRRRGRGRVRRGRPR